ncbi:MAG: hypothetical protein MJ179_01270 [Treponema sp.]|nr:hypothetical protein [Treponema sp.]
MNSFVPPRPGENQLYICTKCKNRFSHKVPKPIIGLIISNVKCPACGGRAIKDPAVRY